MKTVKKPLYQSTLTNCIYILLGITGFGNILDAFNNAYIIPPLVTYIGFLALLAVWLFLEIYLRRNRLKWLISGNQEARIYSLSTKHRLALIGVLILLWVPRVSDWVKADEKQRSNESISTIRVVTVDSQGIPIDATRVWSSIGGNPKKTNGGWEIDITSLSKPNSVMVIVYAHEEISHLSGQNQFILGEELNPVVKVSLSKDESAKVHGIVTDIRGKALEGAQVTVLSKEEHFDFTSDRGSFSLPANAAIGEEVLLRVDKKGYKVAYQWHPAGDEAAFIVLEEE